MPLVLDVQSALKVGRSSLNLTKIVRGSSSNSSEYTDGYGTGTSVKGIPVVLNLSATCVYTERAVAYGMIQACSQSQDSIALQRALGTHQIFTTLWEVIPYSFIIDWFFNVGNYLRDLTPLTGYSFQAYSFSRSVHKTVNGSVVVGTGPTAKTIQISCTVRQKVRVPIWNQGKPILTAENGLNPTRIADAIALMTRNMLK